MTKIVVRFVIVALSLVTLLVGFAGIASAHSTSATRTKHHVLLIDGSTHASVQEDENTSPTNQLTADFKVNIVGALPNEEYDVNSNMVDRCDFVQIVNRKNNPAEQEVFPANTSLGSDGDLGDVMTNFHGNATFFIEGINCIPNDSASIVDEGDYSLWITGDGGSHTSFHVGFEIVE